MADTPAANSMLYDPVANRNITISYDQPLCPYHYKIADLVDQFSTDGHESILDVGCGVGNSLAAIEQLNRNFELTIADVDPRCLSATRAKVPVVRSHQLGSSDDLDQVEGQFDVILLSHVLQYDENPTNTMKQLLNKLRPNGFIVVATPNPLSLPILFNSLLRRDYAKGTAFIWDRSVFKNFLTNVVGSEAYTVTEDYVPLPAITKFGLFRPIERWLARILPWFAFSIIVVLGNEPRDGRED